MSTPYTYSEDNATSLDSATLTQENIPWEQDCNEDSQYSSAVDATLNETYVTAHDSENESHYFSVLDGTGGVILNEFNQLSFNNSKLETDENELNKQGNLEDATNAEPTPTVDIGGQQVVLFKIDGSEELYGLQVVQDEDGNLQKYQFKVRQNEDGNLEAVPETIQLSPLDCEISQLAPNTINTLQQVSNELPEKEQMDQIFIKQENSSDIMPCLQNDIEDFSENQCSDDEFVYENDDDTKTGILETTLTRHFKSLSHSSTEKTFPTKEQETNEDTENQSEYGITSEMAEEEDLDGIYEPNIEIKERSETLHEIDSNDDNVEQLFIEEDQISKEYFEQAERMFHDSEVSQNSQDYEDDTESESDNENYQIVNGMHITADVESNSVHDDFEHNMSEFKLDEIMKNNFMPLQAHTKLQEEDNSNAKNSITNIKIRKILNVSGSKAKDITGRKFFIFNKIEKENVTNNIKINPRSVLKSSQPVLQEKSTDEEKYEKRFAKSKEAIRAKLFQNYIAQTKIIHAPVRQERLPRKQTIKPVARTDEEIIVQEVVICSNGYVETSEDGVLKDRVPLKATETIQLSDTDEDYDPHKQHKIKRYSRKRKSHIPITISDSETEESVIEIDLSESDTEPEKKKKKKGRPPKHRDNEEDSPSKDVFVKRGRGRPPKVSKTVAASVKNTKSSDEDQSTQELKNGNSTKQDDKIRKNSQIMETNCSNIGLTIEKTENKCPKCPKSFPSQGSLKTHIQYHNFRESKIRNLKESKLQDQKIIIEKPIKRAKYECTQCTESFKNNILLTRHLNVHRNSQKNNYECSICRKKFADRIQLNTHKRSHVKEQMFKNTTIPRVSPKKIIIKKCSNENLKCLDCSQVFTSIRSLNIHARSHIHLTCATCKAIFTSKFMLHHHITTNCIKSKLPPYKKHLSSETQFISSTSNTSKQAVKSSIPFIWESRGKGHNPFASLATTSKITSGSNHQLSTKSQINTNPTSLKIQCNICKLTFLTRNSLVKHKVSEHGYKLPEKSMKNLATTRKEHAGIQVHTKLRSAFLNLHFHK